MIAACVGELVACVIRVPCETIKQRAQAQPHLGIVGVFSNSLRSEVRFFFVFQYLNPSYFACFHKVFSVLIIILLEMCRSVLRNSVNLFALF